MNFIGKYNLYKKLVQSSPKEIQRIDVSNKFLRNIKWKIDDKYVISSIYDTEYDWHTTKIHDDATKKLITTFNGFLARRIFNNLQKSL